jgi:hypothetical protein
MRYTGSMQRYEVITEEIYRFIVKALIPAVIAISMKVAIQVKREKVSKLRIFLSYTVGVSSSYFAYSFCKNAVNEDFIPAIIGLIAMSSERITEWVAYKWNIDLFLTALVEAGRDFLINLIKRK